MHRSVLFGIVFMGLMGMAWAQSTQSTQTTQTTPATTTTQAAPEQTSAPAPVATASLSTAPTPDPSAAASGSGSAASNAPTADPIQRSEFSFMVSGVFTSYSGGLPTGHFATHSAGALLGYRIHLDRWEAIEFEYGYTRNGQSYYTPSVAVGAPPTTYLVTSSMQEAIANEVITTPKLGIFQPFILGGGGAAFFTPRPNSAVAATSQTRGAFNAGAGLDFRIHHLGARIEYQELILKTPDFGNTLLYTNRWSGVGQPSVGLTVNF